MQYVMVKIGSASRRFLVAREGSARGASLVEYALLLALIAMACFAAITFLGGDTSDSFSNTASHVSNT